MAAEIKRKILEGLKPKSPPQLSSEAAAQAGAHPGAHKEPLPESGGLCPRGSEAWAKAEGFPSQLAALLTFQSLLTQRF